MERQEIVRRQYSTHQHTSMVLVFLLGPIFYFPSPPVLQNSRSPSGYPPSVWAVPSDPPSSSSSSQDRSLLRIFPILHNQAIPNHLQFLMIPLTLSSINWQEGSSDSTGSSPAGIFCSNATGNLSESSSSKVVPAIFTAVKADHLHCLPARVISSHLRKEEWEVAGGRAIFMLSSPFILS